jgi:hypothetical protein
MTLKNQGSANLNYFQVTCFNHTMVLFFSATSLRCTGLLPCDMMSWVRFVFYLRRSFFFYFFMLGLMILYLPVDALQETLLNLLLRNYLHYNLYDQAEKLRSKAPRFEAHSNQQVC